MKAILKFDLPEEQSAFNDAVNAPDYLCALSDIFNDMRNIIKYHGGSKPQYLGNEFFNSFVEFMTEVDNDPNKPAEEKLDAVQRRAAVKHLEDYLTACGDFVSLYEYRSHLFDIISDKVKENL